MTTIMTLSWETVFGIGVVVLIILITAIVEAYMHIKRSLKKCDKCGSKVEWKLKTSGYFGPWYDWRCKNENCRNHTRLY